MSLAAGTRLGPYKVVGLLGAGGMGEVYRALDTRLGRDVAVKVLPEEFSHEAGRMARFEREAKVLASLNHPNIASIYGLEESNTTPALVMELVEGPTLAERIKRGSFPLDEVLPIAKQIAEALEYAHERGIIHRDLKPSNVKLTPDGHVKVLDFGLAKALEVESTEVELQNSPTLSTVATRAGVLLGTVAYMSPEQACGKRVDRRADIWAFGVVFFEMLTGRRLFTGETISDTLAAVIRAEPDWSSLPGSVQQRIRELLRRCLQKDPKQRLQAIGEARIALQNPVAQEPAQLVAPLSSRLRSGGWIAAGVFALIAAVAMWAPWRVRRPAAGPVVRFTMEIAPAEMLGPVRYFYRPTPTAMAISPDGNTVVFSGTFGSSAPPRHSEGWSEERGQTQLYKRVFDQSDATPIPGTDGAVEPFFSPDGQWVGFFAGGKLKKVPMNGGPAVLICDAPYGGSWGASWASTDNIVFAAVYSPFGLMEVPATGGTPQRLLKPDPAKQIEFYTAPQFLPGGKTLLFTVRTSDNWDEAQIIAMRLDIGEQRVLIKGGADARYLPTGHLVYMQNAVLMAVPFDPQRVQLAGAPVAMLDGVMQAVHTPSRDLETGMGQFAISTSGNLVYAAGKISPAFVRTLVRVDRKGAEVQLNVPKGPYGVVRVSPDGQWIATTKLAEANRTSDIWVVDLNSGNSTRLTSQGTNSWPLWSPDGKRILFSGGGLASTQLLSVAADGSSAPELVSTGKTVIVPASWSRDGKWLAYYEQDPQPQIWIRPMSGPGEPKRFVESEFNVTDGQLSPDGRWMAYVSDESGTTEVYVQAFPGHGEKHRISTAGGSNPTWARNGRELYYLQPMPSGKVAMVAVDFAPGDTFRVSIPRTLFEGKLKADYPMRNYDVTPDGQHFIMLHQEDPPDQRVTKLNVVLNWVDELHRRVATANK
jgi:serine/threonine-protein kinase